MEALPDGTYQRLLTTLGQRHIVTEINGAISIENSWKIEEMQQAYIFSLCEQGVLKVKNKKTCKADLKEIEATHYNFSALGYSFSRILQAGGIISEQEFEKWSMHKYMKFDLQGNTAEITERTLVKAIIAAEKLLPVKYPEKKRRHSYKWIR